MTQRKSFFEAMFDLSFNSYIAVKAIGAIYAILVGLMSLGLIFGILASLSQGFGAFLGSLIGGSIFLLIYVILVRIGFESLVASIKTSEHTAQMLEIMRSKQNPYP
jgi:Domain of unknown function (DUF4282)